MESQGMAMGDGVGCRSLLLHGMLSMSAITCWLFLPHVFPGSAVTVDDFTSQLSTWGSVIKHLAHQELEAEGVD